MNRTQNRLSQATSPYLLQHAANPVDWWPWCDEALQLAREQDKPILLSIGYSACHWCHVMAHESFEDPATAAVMNRLFINIKVDREERPDLDKIYQTAHQLLSQRPGGWPLTVFLMPDDHSPFFAGTYFPPQARHGLPAFVDLMREIHTAYQQQREAICAQNDSLRKAMQSLTPSTQHATLSDAPVHAAVSQLQEHYDAKFGGIGSAPKFPHPNTLDFLLRYGHLNNQSNVQQMALFTLQQMANGGINDLLGGGFCRYSVDDQWMIPHFEKMLYDNGPLLTLYADAWQLDQQRPLFRHVCERTAEWVMREMQSPEGGYFSSLDADSEGEEGRFYVWTREQIAEQLSDDEYDVFSLRFGLDRSANFEGKWHLHSYAETSEISNQLGLQAKQVRRLLKSARDKLFAVREQRAPPGLDDKILTSWNALMIKGMARAGRLLNKTEWIDSAENALTFLHNSHWQDGRLLATSRHGQAHLNAYLDDYAYLIDASLELLQARWNSDTLHFAIALAERLIDHFDDPKDGGFYFTSDDHETLLQRMKPYSDDATPSGNAVAAFALQRLGMLLSEPRYLEASERTLNAAWPSITHMPYAHPGLLITLQEQLGNIETLVIRGELSALASWQSRCRDNYQPLQQVFAIPNDALPLPKGLQEKAFDGKTVAYRCHGLSCQPPVFAIDDL